MLSWGRPGLGAGVVPMAARDLGVLVDSRLSKAQGGLVNYELDVSGRLSCLQKQF